jgi:hypothetical protein
MPWTSSCEPEPEQALLASITKCALLRQGHADARSVEISDAALAEALQHQLNVEGRPPMLSQTAQGPAMNGHALQQQPPRAAWPQGALRLHG